MISSSGKRRPSVSTVSAAWSSSSSGARSMARPMSRISPISAAEMRPSVSSTAVSIIDSVNALMP